MRLLYTIAWCFALPLVATYLLWRSLRQPEYRRHWGERFLGAGALPGAGEPVLWLHAVSLGETRAARPLLEEFARRHPRARFVLTHMTPTGRAAGAELAALAPLSGRCVQRYLPYEIPAAIDRFLGEVRPRLGLLMETEIWPNLLAATDRRAIPVVLVNARLSERSLAKARRLAALMVPAARRLSAVCAQTAADAARIASLYGGPLVVTGNLKFEHVPDAAQLARGRLARAALEGVRVRLYASTREGEEERLLAALEEAGPARALPRTLHVLVPRHPQRFDEVARLLAARGIEPVRRSRLGEGSPGGEGATLLRLAEGGGWLLGDTMGEMAFYYGLAHMALIGGSLLPLGGQNLIEACACGCPVLLGPHMFNFAQASRDACEAGAAIEVADAREAMARMSELSADPARLAKMAQDALGFAAAHRGATARTLAVLEPLLAG